LGLKSTIATRPKAQKTAKRSLIIDFPYSRGRRYSRRSVVAKRAKNSHMICWNICIKSDVVQLNLVNIYSQMIQDSSAFLPRYLVIRHNKTVVLKNLPITYGIWFMLIQHIYVKVTVKIAFLLPAPETVSSMAG
jgi:hypothetical protein